MSLLRMQKYEKYRHLRPEYANNRKFCGEILLHFQDNVNTFVVS